ncbi:putative DUF2921 family protein [Thalictrum thalictroides]|uniref:RING-type E3 ubiquitin transferase n=1 Tax=Thalictrum thalictroides TaxID=46969 RepID=A0A7J6WJM2_THATH|nr:putative DUF2921 family protein [Thalictrum thalictroides]
MDLEIIMVLISSTLICVFVGLQIFYVKKHPDVLPSVSLLMLAILTLGQMIPLVLNFEALFLRNRNRQNVMMIHSHEVLLQPRNSDIYQEHSLWRDLKSYAGLLLDGFLLPQILLNDVFGNSKDKALCPAFYVGVTSVHLLPHAYDLYRDHRYVHSFVTQYIYANPGGEFFSTAWDVIIPCGGLLFAFLIYLQQHFGGCCILPKRFRQSSAYEKVSAARSE